MSTLADALESIAHGIRHHGCSLDISQNAVMLLHSFVRMGFSPPSISFDGAGMCQFSWESEDRSMVFSIGDDSYSLLVVRGPVSYMLGGKITTNSICDVIRKARKWFLDMDHSS